MTTREPLALALAHAASRAVGDSKIGARKGSRTAIAKAMRERGVKISPNTLNRKLAGDYPLTADEIGAMCAVIGVDPDTLWRDALRIMREVPTGDVPLSVHAEETVGPEAAEGIRQGKAAVDERATRDQPNG